MESGLMDEQTEHWNWSWEVHGSDILNQNLRKHCTRQGQAQANKEPDPPVQQRVEQPCTSDDQWMSAVM
eukprot:1146308-Pelagomonas_calceolata.AAC.6